MKTINLLITRTLSSRIISILPMNCNKEIQPYYVNTSTIQGGITDIEACYLEQGESIQNEVNEVLDLLKYDGLTLDDIVNEVDKKENLFQKNLKNKITRQCIISIQL